MSTAVHYHPAEHSGSIQIYDKRVDHFSEAHGHAKDTSRCYIKRYINYSRLYSTVTPTSTMQRLTEVLLLAACMLFPALFVNGLQGIQPTVKYQPVRRQAVIRGLLVLRQSLCPNGFNECEAIGCCPLGWNCCSGSSLLSNNIFFLFGVPSSS